MIFSVQQRVKQWRWDDLKTLLLMPNLFQFFKLTVADAKGKWLNKDQMLTALKSVVNESNNVGEGAPVGGLTSDNRYVLPSCNIVPV